MKSKTKGNGSSGRGKGFNELLYQQRPGGDEKAFRNIGRVSGSVLLIARISEVPKGLYRSEKALCKREHRRALDAVQKEGTKGTVAKL